MSKFAGIRGLYAITAVETGSDFSLEEQVRAAIHGGAAVVQYRDKLSDSRQRHANAMLLRECCLASGTVLIINDDPELACEVDADGVHIGSNDGDPRCVREQIGPARLLGVSCYDSLQRALEAEAAGADYVAFGSIFPSPTKPNAPRATLQLLAEAVARLQVPVVAIGGITEDNARSVVETGVDSIAVVSGLFGSENIELTARRLSGLFD